MMPLGNRQSAKGWKVGGSSIHTGWFTTRVGLRDPFWFSKLFRAEYGGTPSGVRPA